MRIALGIEYDGTVYNGWQRQKTGLGVQQRLEEALTSVADHSVDVTCAGRTDTGVHATGQVIHFDTTSMRDDRGWLLGTNSCLPDDISVMWARNLGHDVPVEHKPSGRRKQRPSRASVFKSAFVPFHHVRMDIPKSRRIPD